MGVVAQVGGSYTKVLLTLKMLKSASMSWKHRQKHLALPTAMPGHRGAFQHLTCQWHGGGGHGEAVSLSFGMCMSPEHRGLVWPEYEKTVETYKKGGSQTHRVLPEWIKWFKKAPALPVWVAGAGPESAHISVAVQDRVKIKKDYGSQTLQRCCQSHYLLARI